MGVAGVTQLKNDGTYGISHNWPRLKTGQNSGYQAINLAYLMGFKKIILLGYDMQITNGKIHWHEPHKGMNPDEHRLKIWKENYKQLAVELIAASVTVLNATRETALDCFKKVDLEQIL